MLVSSHEAVEQPSRGMVLCIQSLGLGRGLQAVALLFEICCHTHAFIPCHQTMDTYLLTGSFCDGHKQLRDTNLLLGVL